MKLVLCHCLLNSTLAVIPPLHPETTQYLKMWWSLIEVGHLLYIEPQNVSSEKSLGHILIFGRELFHAILNIQVTLYTQSKYKKDSDQAMHQVFAYKR